MGKYTDHKSFPRFRLLPKHILLKRGGGEGREGKSVNSFLGNYHEGYLKEGKGCLTPCMVAIWIQVKNIKLIFELQLLEHPSPTKVCKNPKSIFSRITFCDLARNGKKIAPFFPFMTPQTQDEGGGSISRIWVRANFNDRN